jgi:hypothetical protein
MNIRKVIAGHIRGLGDVNAVVAANVRGKGSVTKVSSRQRVVRATPARDEDDPRRSR